MAVAAARVGLFLRLSRAVVAVVVLEAKAGPGQLRAARADCQLPQPMALEVKELPARSLFPQRAMVNLAAGLGRA